MIFTAITIAAGIVSGWIIHTLVFVLKPYVNFLIYTAAILTPISFIEICIGIITRIFKKKSAQPWRLSRFSLMSLSLGLFLLITVIAYSGFSGKV